MTKWLPLAFTCTALLLAPCAFGEPLQALILTGQNNHDWQSTTPVLQRVLQDGGRFEVHVTEQPDQLTAQRLADVDVLLSNWNNWGAAESEPWPEAAREALLGFVRDGGGYVSIHAGSSSFYDWPAYQAVSLATWERGVTGHGPVHAFSVAPAGAQHPITEGMRPFVTVDELWHRAAVQPGATVLATAWSDADKGGTGAHEPVLLSDFYGEGRCANLLLGHDAAAFRRPAVAAMLRRTAQWAAGAEVTAPWPKTGWKQTSDALELTWQGQTLWRLNYGPACAKPYFDPLAPVGGPSLTWEAPPDHPWHHGLWFSWKYVNGVNYWEEDAGTGRAEGLTRWDPPQIATTPEGSAEVLFKLRYAEPGEAPVLTEIRELYVTAPGARGRYHIEWTAVFEAQTDVVLDRTPPAHEPDGVSWGGYAGLSLRLPDVKDPVSATDKGIAKITGGTAHPQAFAADYSGVLGGRPWGVAMLQDPRNPVSPVTWYVITQPGVPFHYVSPAFLFQRPMELEAGQRLRLRYRIEPHSGRWGPPELREALAERAKAPSGP